MLKGRINIRSKLSLLHHLEKDSSIFFINNYTSVAIIKLIDGYYYQ